MKIVCDKCATKYSIADEKVSGKVFKIRCKKCSHIIVVKGDGAAAGAEPMTDNDDGATVAGLGAGDAQQLAGAGEDRAWYLVVSGEQVGPFTPSEVRGKVASGEVDVETYGWKEGFADWLRLAAIDEFHDLGGASNGANGAGETRRTDLNDMFSARAPEEDDGAADIFGGGNGRSAAATAVAGNPASDLFASQATVTNGGGHGQGQGQGQGQGMFGGDSTELARPRSGGSAMGSSMGEDSHDSKLTGQRNENSVLFSLSNLTALATSSPAPRAAAAPVSLGSMSSPSPQLESRPGYATAKNEGSGLIDIRAMAAATLSAVGPGSSSSSSSVDIPSFSAAPVFSPVVSAPMMVPQQSSGMPKWIFGLLGGVGLLVAGAIGLVAVVLSRKPEAPQMPVLAQPAVAAPIAAGGGTVAAGVNPTAARNEGTPAAVENKAEATRPAVAVAEKADERPAQHAAAVKHERGAAAKKGGASSAAVATNEAPRVAPAAPAPKADDAPKSPKNKKPAGSDDGLDDLLNAGAGGGKPARASRAEAAPVPAADPNLPEQLDRGDVVAGMKGVAPKASACYQQYHVPGIAMVSLTIGKSGAVSRATVGGALAGTPSGDCVEKAVKSAHFKPFKGQPMSIQYPFSLR